MIVLLAAGETSSTAQEAEKLLTSVYYTVERLNTPKELMDRASESGYSLAIVCSSLYPENPLAPLYLMNAIGDPAPTLYLSDTPEEPGLHVLALEAGADDGVTIPVYYREFLVRIRNLIRRAAPTMPRPSWRGLALDPETPRLLYQGRTAPLTKKQAALLELLLRRPDSLHTQAELLSALWSVQQEPDVLFTNVSGLRKALTALGCPHRILLRRGEGYLLTAPEETEE